MRSNSRSGRRISQRRMVAPVAGVCLLIGLSGSGVAYAQDVTSTSDTVTTEAATPTTVAEFLDTTTLPPTTLPPSTEPPTTEAPTTTTEGTTTEPPTTEAPTTTEGSTTTLPPTTEWPGTTLPGGATSTTGTPTGTTTGTTVPSSTTTGTTSRPSTTRSGSSATASGPRSSGATRIPSMPLVPVVPGRTIDALDLSGKLAARQLEVFRVAAELDRMDDQLGALIEEYNLLQLKLQIAKQAVLQMQEDLATTQGELANANEALRTRVVGAYKSDGSALGVILNTTDMADFIKRIGLLITIARSDRNRVDEVGSLRSRADRQLDGLSREIYDLTLATQRLTDQRRLIESQLAERKAYLARLGADVQVLVEQQRETARNIVPAGVDLAAYASADGQGIVRTALTYVGVPYVWGGATPSGFDCSGLVQYVYMQHGIYLPHYSGFQAQMGIEVPLPQIRPGDLVAFKTPVSHIGIYVGDGLYIQAPRTGDVVKVSSLADRSDLTHIRRILVSPGPMVADVGSNPTTTP